MAYTCDVCQEVVASDGSLRIHQLVAHLDAGPSSRDVPFEAGPQAGKGRRQAHRDRVTPGRRPYGKVVGLLAVLSLGILAGGVASAGFRLDEQRNGGPVQVRATSGGASEGAEEEAAVDPGQEAVGTADEAVVEEPVPEPSNLPDGYRHVSLPDRGFSIAVPGWFEDSSISDADLRDGAAYLEDDLPEISRLMAGGTNLDGQVQMFAMDPTTGSNQMVQKIPARGLSFANMPPGLFTDIYTEMGVGDVQEQLVDLPAGQALRVSGSFTAQGVTVPLVQHVLLHNGSGWILTYTEAGGGDAFGTATTIANTFQYLV